MQNLHSRRFQLFGFLKILMRMTNCKLINMMFKVKNDPGNKNCKLPMGLKPTMSKNQLQTPNSSSLTFLLQISVRTLLLVLLWMTPAPRKHLGSERSPHWSLNQSIYCPYQSTLAFQQPLTNKKLHCQVTEKPSAINSSLKHIRGMLLREKCKASSKAPAGRTYPCWVNHAFWCSCGAWGIHDKERMAERQLLKLQLGSLVSFPSGKEVF